MFLLHVSFTSIRAKCEKKQFSFVSCLLNIWQIFLVKEQALRSFKIQAKIKDNLSYFAFIFISDFMGFLYVCMLACVYMCILMYIHMCTCVSLCAYACMCVNTLPFAR